MTVAISFSPTVGRAMTTQTVNFTGLTTSTAFLATLGTTSKKSIPFTSDGSGNGTFTFVPQDGGTTTVTVVAAPTAASTVITGTVTHGGS